MLHRPLWAIVAVVLISLSFGCTNKDERQIYWEHDPNTQYRALRTYAVEKNLEPFFDAREKQLNANFREVIDAEIHKQMSNKGFTRAEPGRQADVVVRYFGGIEQTGPIDPPTRGVRRSERTPPPAATIYVPLSPSGGGDRPKDRGEGRLVIEIVDPRNGRGLWRATAENAIPSAIYGPQGPQMLREAVAAMLGRFPPPP